MSLSDADRLKRFRRLLEEGCHQGCDYDEAEGGLIDHCDKCCHTITSYAYDILIIRMEWPELYDRISSDGVKQ